jgi:EAL domain-containing protein (putative c-di-GMP-specific phosphodiesterase class I)
MTGRRRQRETWTYSGDSSAPTFSPHERSTRTITSEDLGVVFQPIVALDTGVPFASEALVRCHWPEFQSPLHLFEVAVQERSCGRLGRVIRDLAFTQAPDLPLFVNLHPQELSSRWLVRPDDPMNFHQHPVYLEITESAAFDHFQLVKSAIKEVCSRNDARLVVDDFGAGYSNLKRVVELEPAVIKLDRALVQGLHQSERQQTLVQYVVRLCNALGAKVVAEGIETVGELRAVRDCGVEYGQGYVLARPANPSPEVTFPLEPLTRRGRRPPTGLARNAPPKSSRPTRSRRPFGKR